ncbi:MAG: SAM-dependent chlorinase/fluorinase [candidate division Zixibacteria bacterium]|nr:SAM-dependent chlorinase/fluorinase [candidate division Zixibacteria bacterium]
MNRPLITLTTDFGMADGTVGAMIGVIKSICPVAEIFNLASDIPAHNIVRGAWALLQAAPFFPSDAIHIAVVDPGVGSGRRGLLVNADRGTFIGPDNGVLSWAAARGGNPVYRALENPSYRLGPMGFTFDGRDLFAPAAAHLACGVSPEEFGPPIRDSVVLSWPEPRRSVGRIEGEIMVIDHFGNLISNISFDLVAEEFANSPVEVTVAGRKVGGIRAGYLGISEDVGVVVNGTGLLEIAAPRGSASAMTGLNRGAPIFVTAGSKP